MPTMVVKLRTCCRPWWYNRPRLSLPFHALTRVTCRAPRPMELTAMAPLRNGHGGQDFACRPPSVAKPNQGWARFAMRSSVAITSSRSLGAYLAALIARPAVTWGGLNWPHVSSYSAQVLSHDPKRLYEFFPRTIQRNPR